MHPYIKRIACLIIILSICTPALGDDPAEHIYSHKRPHSDNKGYPPVEVYVHLSEGFHSAMQGGTQQSTTSLSTHMSENYLKQIAIASRYTVETNLEILKQQERIIQLLESIQSTLASEKR